MAVRIRLARAGARNKPFYRVVVSDSRSPRDGRFIEIVGRYNPRTSPSLVELDLDRIKEWISKGASPSETVEKLMAIAESPGEPPKTAKDARPSKKVAATAKAAAEPAAEVAPALAEAPEDAPAEDVAEEAEPAVDETPAEVPDEPAEEAEAEPADEPAEEAEAEPADEPAEEPTEDE